jgi:putative hydroxymethylpyrimidine transport system permease protein
MDSLGIRPIPPSAAERNGRSGSASGTPPALRTATVVVGLVLLWQAIVLATGAPRYILPGPLGVFAALVDSRALILFHAWLTIVEIVLGLLVGTIAGSAAAVLLAYFGWARHWLLPVLVASQAIPVFAVAPLLVLWLGYGMASKVAMAALIIFFPVTTAFFDGLRRTDPAWLDTARTLGADRRILLWRVRVPAALPGLASGLRVAVAVAPIGAIVGEWVGSSAGLGYLMLHSNARVQIELMFAALITLMAIGVALYLAADAALRRLVFWQADAPPAED